MGGELREDEIEALLKFDGTVLQVWKDADGFTAVIYICTPPIKTLSHTRETRMEAVQGVWNQYNRYLEAKRKDEVTAEWYLYEAKANVKIKLHEMIRPKGKSKWLK